MQSFLELHKRPVVQFDPKNPQHREQAAIFLRSGTWARSPWAFYAPNNLSIKAYAMETMVDYYIDKEFQATATEVVVKNKKSRKPVAEGKLIAIRRGSK